MMNFKYFQALQGPVQTLFKDLTAPNFFQDHSILSI